jgi:hypothetical protein
MELVGSWMKSPKLKPPRPAERKHLKVYPLAVKLVEIFGWHAVRFIWLSNFARCSTLNKILPQVL